MIVQNGGGYGDPILREPALVERDVRNGAVSRMTARDIRRSRQANAEVHGGLARDAESSAGEGLRWGDAIIVHSNDGALHFTCGHCKSAIGGFRGSWRDAALLRHPKPAELGPHVRLDERFIFDQLVCPHCATSLWVDVRKCDEAPPVDFSLA